jgi:hypothetical protein
VEERHQKGDEHAGDPADQRSEDDTDEGGDE